MEVGIARGPHEQNRRAMQRYEHGKKCSAAARWRWGRALGARRVLCSGIDIATASRSGIETEGETEIGIRLRKAAALPRTLHRDPAGGTE
ncbi:hypothetical protein EVAR_18079_1 [Eumeta japonica]|uniref:Uncharacterized protein n=1 Tax=Eumeta variegata TaxID=151549 RepID=A0A4C1VHY3_EUMVA|nr:hypothetical protein EVAR_18079_1 [Eumeta japonica]